MIQEIYTKTLDDATYQRNVISHSDVYETVLSKIRMILFTKPGEVLGDVFFGVNLEEYVFALNASNTVLQKAIEEQIYTYVPERLVMPIRVEVSFVQQETYDAAFIDIHIDGRRAIGLLVSA